MTRDEFAKMLNGREYGSELTKDEVRLAKEGGLLVVFGASDDLTEFNGVYDDEIGAYNGAKHYFIRIGDKWRSAEYDGTGVEICAKWSPSDSEASWEITTGLPHSSFDIKEDGELFCIGCVIDEKDMIAACKVDLTTDEIDAGVEAVDNCEISDSEDIVIAVLTAAALARI